MTDDEPYSTVRPSPVLFPSDRFHTAGETLTRDEWQRRHDETYEREQR